MNRKKKNRRKGAGRKKSTGGSGPATIVGTIGLTDDNPGVFTTEVPRGSERAYMDYLEMHDYLPHMYVFDETSAPHRTAVSNAIDVLSDKQASRTALSRALILLGHSPSREAIFALQRFAESNHYLARIARFALDECLGWAGSTLKANVAN